MSLLLFSCDQNNDMSFIGELGGQNHTLECSGRFTQDKEQRKQKLKITEKHSSTLALCRDYKTTL